MEVYLLMSDDELVALYTAGNNMAFDVLLERHKQSLYDYILYLVHNTSLADDIFQDTFVKVITVIKQGRCYTGNGKFRAWIMRVAHNLVIDYFRQEKKENTISNDDHDSDLFNNPKLCDDNIEIEIVNSQILLDVRKIVDFLPDTQREVLTMRYFNDMSYKEIAEKTGVSLNTALGRMRYAILNMRKIVEENKIILSK